MVDSQKTTVVKCHTCGKEFEKDNYEIERSKSPRSFCSMRCTSSYAVKIQHGDTVGFGFYFNKSRKTAKVKGLGFDLTKEFLKNLFEKQSGKCAVTGVEMILNKSRYLGKDKSPYYASLDRIDNSRGYMQDNVQFVCLAFNYMRNTFSIDQSLDFISSVCNSLKIK